MNRKKNKGGTLFLQVLILIFVFIPILWGLRTALTADYLDINIIPKKLTLDNFILTLQGESFLQAMGNSILYALGTILVLLPIIVPAAYAMARLNFPGKQLQKILLLLPMLPAIVILIPIAKNMQALGLINSRWGVVLLMVTFQLPFTCWILRNFFRSIPLSLEEAGYVDGCSKLQGIWHIILPNSLPGVVSIAVYSFISSWLSYLIPFTLITAADKKTLTQTLLGYIGPFGTDYPRLTAAALLTILPPLLFFTFFQKYFIAGLFGLTDK